MSGVIYKLHREQEGVHEISTLLNKFDKKNCSLPERLNKELKVC